jgi:hypothetical protein
MAPQRQAGPRPTETTVLLTLAQSSRRQLITRSFPSKYSKTSIYAMNQG